MKSNIIALAGAGALALAGLTTSAALDRAEAQAAKAPIILVLNQGQVIAQSKSGKSIGPQVEKLNQQATTEFNAEVEKLTKEGEDLKKQKDLMAEDVWLEKAKQFSVKQNNLPVMRDVKVRELEMSQQQAVGQINEALKPILKKIVDGRGATLLLDRSVVMYSSVDTDITAEVIAELDKVLTTVKVQKVSLAEMQRQAEAQAAAQKGKQGGKN